MGDTHPILSPNGSLATDSLASPDHAGTLPFLREEPPERLSAEQLDTRVGDLDFLLAQLMDEATLSEHEVLNPLRIDVEQIGVIGHSFGAVTVGRFAHKTQPFPLLWDSPLRWKTRFSQGYP